MSDKVLLIVLVILEALAIYNLYDTSADVTFFYLFCLIFIFYDCCVTCNVSFFFVANYVAGDYVFVAHTKT